MAKTDTSFDSANQPSNRRGKAFKTKVFEVMKENAIDMCPPDATREEVEKVYLTHFVKRAFNAEQSESSMLLKSLNDKMYPGLKPTMPSVKFEFDENASVSDKTNQIIKAATEGNISPDVASIFLAAIKDQTVIEANTDLKARIEAIEAMLGE